MKTKIINAIFPNGEYPIYIGQNILDQAELLQRHIVGKQVMMVTNETIAPLYLTSVQKALNNYQSDVIILPDGEQYKTLEQLSTIWDQLAKKKHHRDTTLIALGGGVIGDMTGFAAACYQRGVAFIQIPTTLLSQVDASIGGKTAINHPLSKNLIGAFYQPRAVIIDTNTLDTLPEREFNAGIAEIIKAALIKDENFFDQLEKDLSKLLVRETDELIKAIEHAIIIKRDIVTEDEKEHGIRVLLNFGHTFAHAIEQNLGYGQWLHGEAVATGMILAANLSEKLGWLDKQEVKRIDTMIEQIPLPKRLPLELKCDKLVAAMQSDKKVLNQKIRLVLLKKIGKAIVTDKVTNKQLTEFLEQKLKT